MSFLVSSENHSLQLVGSYYIEDGWIKRKLSEGNDGSIRYFESKEELFDYLRPEFPVAYDPLEDYRDYREKFGKIGKEPTSMPHIDFANLDYNDENEILKFCNKWGVLGLRRDLIKGQFRGKRFDATKFDDLASQGIKDWEDFKFKATFFLIWESVEKFKLACWAYQQLVRVKKAIFPDIDHDAVRALMEDNEFKKYLKEGTFQTTQAAMQYAECLAVWLEEPLRTIVRVKTPKLVDGKIRFETHYECYNLISSMYAILDASIENHIYFKTCKYERCGNTFETSSEKQKYCCETHRNRDKVSKHYHTKVKLKVVPKNGQRSKAGE